MGGKTKATQFNPMVMNIFKAVEVGDIPCLQMLLPNDDINARDRFGHTPLHWACLKGQLDTVKWLIEKGANINARSDCIPGENAGIYPIHCAAESGSVEIVKLLLKKGAKIDAKKSNGETPLVIAVDKGRQHLVEVLLEAGANVNLRGQSSITPLHIAVTRNRVNIADRLIRSGADVHFREKDFGQTLLIEAASEGFWEIVQLLIKARVDVQGADNDGTTALRGGCFKGCDRTVNSLVSAGTEVNAKDRRGWTPLFYAVRGGHLEIIEILRKEGADEKHTDSEGRTAKNVAEQFRVTGIADFAG